MIMQQILLRGKKGDGKIIKLRFKYKGRNSMIKNSIISTTILFFLSVLLFTGCSKEDENIEEKIPVEVKTMTLGSVIQSINYNGDIKAEFEVKVFSKIPDRIDKFFVDEGDYVQRNAPIASILATTIEQGVRQAEAGLTAARAQESNVKIEFERAQRLYSENAMSQQQFDAIKTQYESVQSQVVQAEAALKSVKSQFSDATITAPISGIIGKRYAEAGDMTSPANPLVSIVQMDKVKIEFSATEEDLGKLATGQKALVTVKSYPDTVFSGKLMKISPVLDPLTRMADVEVLIDNPLKILKPGMYAEVEVITGEIKDVLVVPRFATIENTTLRSINGEDQVIKNYYVYIINNEIAHQRRLEVLYVNHKNIAVKSGIDLGDKLVVSGQNNLRDSVKVMIARERSN
jgi:membrane fusion protein (multidrug efflux system)